MVGQSVALWEPDITPPDEWLFSGVLYQERISTFAPWPGFNNRDGRAADRLRALLGDLYLPLSFGDALNSHAGDAPLHELRGRLRVWQEWAQRTVDRTRDPLVRRWLERSMDWPRRARLLREQTDHLLVEERQAQADVDRRIAELNQASDVVANLTHKAKEVNERVGPTVQRAHEVRRVARSNLLKERDRLISTREGLGANAETDWALQRINAALEVAMVGGKPREQEELEAARGRVGNAKAKERAASIALAQARADLADIRNRRLCSEHARRAPWEGDVAHDLWSAADGIHAQVPFGFDTLAPGKLHGEVIEFLATEGGMWVSQDPCLQGVGTLIGPGRIIRDVLRIIALWHCNKNDGWVPMSGESTPHLADYEPVRTSELVTVGVRALLPIPAHARIEDVIAFRVRHEAELAAVRQAIAEEFPPVESIDEVTDFLQLMRFRLAEPLAEVERAIELDASLQPGHVVQTALHRAGHGTRTAVAGLVAAGIASPVFGNTIGVSAVEATAAGGVVLTATAMGARMLRAGFDRLRQPRHGPYQYVYDVGRTFGL